jgi:hypothetical protein
MTIDLGWIGVWLLVISGAAVVVELAIMGAWSFRLARRSQLLSQSLMAQQAALEADAERLETSIAQMSELWKPYARLLRWLQHPIAIALIRSYAGRRAAR